jgi:hypothetical protein
MKKECPACGNVKNLFEFSWRQKSRKKKQSWCKKCKREAMNKYLNTERGYLKDKYNNLRKKKRYQKRNGRQIKCYFTCDELLTAFGKHKSIYGMKSAWGPGVDHLEQHLPITMIQEGNGKPGTRGGSRKGAKRLMSNLSVDRLDSGRHYTLQNIIFIRNDENGRKKDTSYEDCKIQMRLHEERFINMKSI